MKRIKGMGSLLRYLICIACVAVILLPIGILIHGSFQGGGIKNYVDILTKYHIETYFINSLIISVSVVVLVVVLDVLAGFALSKLSFPLRTGYIFFCCPRCFCLRRPYWCLFSRSIQSWGF